MALAHGTRFGPYEIQSAIGAGGMGEVYKARDSKLNRDVAIKVLPDLFSNDPARLARFQREAELLASLNHPNIAAIYGVEGRALVMELVDGRSPRGPLPFDEAWKVAAQIVSALEYAHERGVVHRDLKPSNILVTPEGVVKLLDFGLAKAFTTEKDPSASPENTPTLGETRVGAVLGTPAYMAPEQARGRSVDKRADIWSFGVVLYELLTGERLFSGEDASEIMAAVIQKQPDVTKAPRQARRLLDECLQKDPRQRLRDIGDAQRLVGGELAHAPLAPRRQSWLSWSAAVVLALAASAATWILKGSTPAPTVRLAITLPPAQRLAALNLPALAISPDGRTVVYVAAQSGAIQQLYRRALDRQEPEPISGTEGAVEPFFSPDGQWIGFFAGGKLKKVSANVGAAVTIAVAPSPGGASWNSRGTLAVQLRTTGQQGLQQISEEGGEPQPLTRNGKGEFIQRWPEFLPGGQAVLFVGSATGASWGGSHIVVESIRGGGPQNPPASPKILAQGTQPRYAPTGHVLYAQSGTLMAAPFDAKRLSLTGAAVPALNGVMQVNTTGAAQYSLSSTGTLAYVAGGLVLGQSRLVWVSRTGDEQPLPAVPHNYLRPRVSPDGRRVAVEIIEQEEQTWVYDISRDNLTRLAFEGNVNNIPAWSSDGRRIAFSSNRAGVASNMFWMDSNGSGGAERLATSNYVNFPTSFSPDGQLLAYIEVTPETGSDIWVLRMSERKTQPFLRAPYEETAPAFSPDGRWLAYSSDESGRREIVVQPYPGPGGKRQISTDGGQEPVWNPKGGELFYRNGTRIMAVDVTTRSAFSTGKPRPLFEGPYLTGGAFAFYDISPDGQRFLMLKPVESPSSNPTQINVVLNWLEELKRLVPTK